MHLYTFPSIPTSNNNNNNQACITIHPPKPLYLPRLQVRSQMKVRLMGHTVLMLIKCVHSIRLCVLPLLLSRIRQHREPFLFLFHVLYLVHLLAPAAAVAAVSLAVTYEEEDTWRIRSRHHLLQRKFE